MPGNGSLNVPLDPSLYPPSPPFRISLFERRDVPLNNGALLIVHLLNSIITLWHNVRNKVIAARPLYLDYRNLRTSVIPLPNASRSLDYRTLGYVIEDVIVKLLEQLIWRFGLWVRVFRRDIASIDEIVQLWVQLRGTLDRNPVNSSTTSPMKLRAGERTLDSSIRLDVYFTGTEMSRRGVCSLFYEAIKRVVHRESESYNPQSEDLGIARLVSSDGLAQMKVDVNPYGTFTVEELADGLLRILEYYADRDVWESSHIRMSLDERLIAKVDMGMIVGEGGQNRTATS